MSHADRIALGYVMVACVASRRLKGGKRIYARAYGKKCFPIWRKPGGNAKGHANDVT